MTGIRNQKMARYLQIFFLGFLFGLACGEFSSGQASSIINSKHNLSAGGPGAVKASTESQICIFCHAPHNASGAAPLWNRYESGQAYIPYTSTTAKAAVGQPTGSSKMCLSCHDGTVALGMVYSRAAEIPFASGITILPPGESNLGIDLSDDHPISFYYDTSLTSQNPELNDPSTLTGAVKLDKNGQLQCVSCHDPHNDQYGKFMTMNAINAGLCLQCHNKTGWVSSVHNNSPKTWNGVAPDPWPHTVWTTVAQNGCGNCHLPHNAGGRERLLRYGVEEDNCFICHNGNAAGTDIEAEFNKLSVHPVTMTGGNHDPAESALVSSSRHVECVDCHNPHAANSQDTPLLPGSLRSLKGVDAGGAPVNLLSREYELCFRCHGDSGGSRTYVTRQYPETNTRFEFDPVNASYHPVLNVGRNPDVPSLISPYTTASTIQCTGCHNNNQGPQNSGTGPNGPHGSAYPPLLERQLLLTDGLTESSASYALCYKCHDRTRILNNTSFPEHNKHIVAEKAACTVCHDAHGVRDKTHLINFDRNVVSPNSVGKFLFEDLGRFRGRCYLRCHNEEHNPESY